jgi:hypothetical protein
MGKKVAKKRPKMKVQVRRMIYDWWILEGSLSVSKFVRKNFDKYFEVK